MGNCLALSTFKESPQDLGFPGNGILLMLSE